VEVGGGCRNIRSITLVITPNFMDELLETALLDSGLQHWSFLVQFEVSVFELCPASVSVDLSRVQLDLPLLPHRLEPQHVGQQASSF
jgi:hypothetical protein